MILYRYVDSFHGNDQANADCIAYQVVKETEHGYWIDFLQFMFDGFEVTTALKTKEQIGPVNNKTGYRWIRKPGSTGIGVFKGWAWPDQASALRSYHQRKQRHVKILEKQLRRAKACRNLAQDMVAKVNQVGWEEFTKVKPVALLPEPGLAGLLEGK